MRPLQALLRYLHRRRCRTCRSLPLLLAPNHKVAAKNKMALERMAEGLVAQTYRAYEGRCLVCGSSRATELEGETPPGSHGY